MILFIFFQHFINNFWFMIVCPTQFHDIFSTCGCPCLAFTVVFLWMSVIRTQPKNSVCFCIVFNICKISLVYQNCTSILGNCEAFDFLYIVQIWNMDVKLNEIKKAKSQMRDLTKAKKLRKNHDFHFQVSKLSLLFFFKWIIFRVQQHAINYIWIYFMIMNST